MRLNSQLNPPEAGIHIYLYHTWKGILKLIEIKYRQV